MKKAKFWFKNEKEVMKKLGFEPVKGSGSGWIHKEDGESEFALAQLKSTEAESYKLNYLDIEKLEYHASVSHKIPVFVIEFLNRGIYVLLNVSDFERIKELCFGGQKHEEDLVISEDIIEERLHLTDKKLNVKSSSYDREKFYKEREKQWKKRKR